MKAMNSTQGSLPQARRHMGQFGRAIGIGARAKTHGLLPVVANGHFAGDQNDELGGGVCDGPTRCRLAPSAEDRHFVWPGHHAARPCRNPWQGKPDMGPTPQMFVVPHPPPTTNHLRGRINTLLRQLGLDSAALADSRPDRGSPFPSEAPGWPGAMPGSTGSRLLPLIPKSSSSA
jgi:hypothetical protein